jgi:hypothetical protein
MCGDLDWIHLAQYGGSCEHSNEPSGSIKDREFLNQTSVLSLGS